MSRSKSLFIGWDVGGWNCDKNPRSRDAIVILDSERILVGKPWRGNLRRQINAAETFQDFATALLAICEAEYPRAPANVTFAIDTSLGFSVDLIALVGEERTVDHAIEESKSNPYLFRQTERFLFENHFSPLSAIKDMIGSQATKGLHTLAKLGLHRESCGVWSSAVGSRAIETYPAPCKNSAIISDMRSLYKPFDHADKEDALICALIAYLFVEDRESLIQPTRDVPASEGWIWIPADVVSKAS